MSYTEMGSGDHLEIGQESLDSTNTSGDYRSNVVRPDPVMAEEIKASRLAQHPDIFADEWALQFDIPVELYEQFEAGAIGLPPSVIAEMCTLLGIPWR